MRTQTVLIALSSTILFWTHHPAAHAQVVALDPEYNAGSQTAQPANSTYGWNFTVGPSSLSVTHLGYFDLGQDGLQESHQVGIWNSEGAILTQGTVVSSDSLTGNFRFSLVTPATLEAGETYYIGAHSPSGLDAILHSGPAAGPTTFASEISYIGAVSSTGFSFPGTPAGLNVGVIGPNFQFTPVPEPHEYALVMGLGLAGFYSFRKVRSRRRAAHTA